MQKGTLLILSILLCQIVQAQFTFSGTVLDTNREPLFGAQVILSKNDSLFAVSLTDVEGLFSIPDIPQGEYLL